MLGPWRDEFRVINCTQNGAQRLGETSNSTLALIPSIYGENEDVHCEAVSRVGKGKFKFNLNLILRGNNLIQGVYFAGKLFAIPISRHIFK